ncbi:3-hydroxyacyl-CoA dehydrogenase family protein [Chelatococcus asaccharovorans]|uniref:3-hydroxyacyl-CoA dehydrogenase n=1 Tax=Chelatococcus asaccharovorans TaxID=28210 RepID=A0A2V3U583_9HYPH|nr:3-hydroxyacyl-CoA dehydrogenase family protein [Chelatococcus asaccharovorans]MBS7703719.1 3-hydroxyacyl-CoA dehydrogenase family protein [Chelatococcus asaccharovorans]PXW57877.1 3-hydroxyacyl-CoA dehydrogenase [Chelatococcus asaccharovorans]
MKQSTNVAVCGAGGTMGAGIAIVSARSGHRTICYDTSASGLERARGQIEKFFAKSVSLGKLTAEQQARALDGLTMTTSLDDLGACELVIEAVFENLEVKKQLFGKLDSVCAETAVFASNTSTLSITEIAAGSARPDRVVGMHFCLPAQLMALVEMTPGLRTDAAVFDAAWNWVTAAGQVPVRTQDKPGFILNALLVPFNNDAIRAVEAGVASPADIDRAIKTALGNKLGPLELVDLVGLDTQVRLCDAFYANTYDPRAAAPPLLKRMVAAGLLGRKSGRGFFAYSGQAMFGA